MASTFISLPAISLDNTTPINVTIDPSGDSVKIFDSNNNTITATNGQLNVIITNTTSSVTPLNALNAFVSIALQGRTSVGFQLSPGTLIGTIVAEASVDGGTNWTIVPFFDPANSSSVNSITFSSPNPLKILSIIPIGGATHIRVRVSAYTSGTANAILTASEATGAAGTVTAAAFANVSNTFVAVPSNTATLVLASNANRKYAYFSNLSGSNLNIQFGISTGLSASTGLIVNSGTYYEIRGDGLFTGNIYGYSANAITISVSEGTP